LNFFLGILFTLSFSFSFAVFAQVPQQSNSKEARKKAAAHEFYLENRSRGIARLNVSPQNELTTATTITLQAIVDGVLFSEGNCAIRKELVFSRLGPRFVAAVKTAPCDWPTTAEMRETIGKLDAGQYEFEVVEVTNNTSSRMGLVKFEVLPIISDEHALASAIMEYSSLNKLLEEKSFSRETLNAALLLACERNSNEIPRIVKAGAQPAMAVHYAAQLAGRREAYFCLKSLINKFNVDPNLEIKGLPPVLIFGASGTLVEAKLPRSGTPLMTAVSARNWSAVEVLLENGADLWLKSDNGASAQSMIAEGDFNEQDRAEIEKILEANKITSRVANGTRKIIDGTAKGAQNIGYGLMCVLSVALGGRCW
jgi:hypothetical protein